MLYFLSILGFLQFLFPNDTRNAQVYDKFQHQCGENVYISLSNIGVLETRISAQRPC